ncbi:MAG: SDR family oxidoreductase [Pseudomonadota bacterium]
MNANLSEKTILVIGAARGIGAALCALLARDGARVVAIDKIPVEAETFIRVDLSSLDTITSVIDALPGKVDAVAGVAGVPGTLPPETVLCVNFFSQRRLFEACIPRLTPNAAAVFVSSITAHRCDWSDKSLEELVTLKDREALRKILQSGISGADAYTLSKRLLNYWLLSRIPEFAAADVRTNLVSPGPVNTAILSDFETSMGKERIDASAQLVGRHGTAEEIAAPIHFLLGDASRWVNGIELKVDGGFHALRQAKSQTGENSGASMKAETQRCS